jgi:hypothetical protein
VNLEKKMQGFETPDPAPVPVAPAPPLMAVVPMKVSSPAAAPAAAASDAEGDDLFAEFASAPADTDGGGLDTDKMMAEMAALVNMEPAKGTALNDDIDTEKMAAEATRLVKS